MADYCYRFTFDYMKKYNKLQLLADYDYPNLILCAISAVENIQ